MLVPSIDIMNGRVVQLKQGRTMQYETSRDPVEIAGELARYGTPAVIDLDAARGTGCNLELVKDICRATGARAGGGIRTADRAMELLRAGASRVIIGTSLWDDFVLDLPKDRVQGAIDTFQGKVMTEGWQTPSSIGFSEQISKASQRVSSLLCTFIEVEGSMTGLPPARVEELKKLTELPITVAGGVSDTDNATELLLCQVDLQVGMALYTGLMNPNIVISGLLPLGKLTPTIVQDQNGQVLMLAWSTRESLRNSLETGKGIYHSRSRNQLWIKGETSGNTQELLSCRFDCDRDTLLFTVKQKGKACHTESYSCFGNRVFTPEVLKEVISTRRGMENSLTSNLLENPDELRRKLIEEAGEVVFANNRDDLIWEAADLVYFLSVLIHQRGCCWRDIWAELEGRSLK